MKAKISAKEITFRPLTAAALKDFEKLFGKNGACAGCWCMLWRLSRKEWEEGQGDVNNERMRKLAKQGEEPGIIAYYNNEAIGWVAAAPREKYPYLERSRVLKPVDDKPVWSVSCLFIKKEFRNMGLSSLLLKEVRKFAGARGGKIVEGYPYEPAKEMPGSFVWTGLPGSFLKAGYKEVARFSPTRPIFRAKASPKK